jgi:ribosomal protein S18 acetylase RimI-like enzyme
MPTLNPAMLQLRPATPDDREFLWRLHRETMRVYVDRTWGWDHGWQRAHFDENFDAAPLRIVEHGTRMIGCIAVQRSDDEIFLASIEIAPEFQNQGIGTRLIGDVLDEADRLRLAVRLRVLRVNPARGLYERLGFQSTAETPTHFVMMREARTEPPAD